MWHDSAMELRETIDLEVERLGLPALRTELAALQHELWSTVRREGDLRRSISLWDRWMIFSDTAAEKQLKGGRRRRAQVERSLAYVRSQVAAANAKLGELCPPFAVAIGLSECLPLAYTGLAVEGWLIRRVERGDDLQAALTALALQLRETYFPGLDFAALRRRLADASQCQALAGLAEVPLPGSARLGHAPLSGDAPLGRVAERLLDNGFFAAHYREEELDRRCRELEAKVEKADDAVGWFDRINVFSKSWDEVALDQATGDLQRAQAELRKAIERQQRLLHDAMRAFPPLDFYHGVAEALGIAVLLKADTEPVVSSKGAIEKRAVIAPRALLLAAVKRLQGVFAATFPGVPGPHELAHRTTSDAPGLHGHAGAAVFIELAGRSQRLAALRDEALVHAGMVGQIGRELEDVEGQISLIDRLVFWSDTDAEKAAASLARRGEANTAWTWQLWRAMLDEARTIGAHIGPLAARDAALTALLAIPEIHTDPGSSSFPIDCSVHKREEAMAALHALRDVFARIYGVRGSLSQLMATVAASEPAGHTVYEDPVHTWAPLEPEALHGLLAQRLADTDFKRHYQAAAASLGQLGRADEERAAVEGEISVWDRINIFKTTEAEARRDQLKQQVGGLRADLGARQAALASMFWEALRGYPPALLCAEIDAVLHAVEDIRAVCRSYTVTVGSGKNRTTQTRYRCDLIGKEEAERAMQRWASLMVQAFGEQLGYHELLEAVELGAQAAEEPQS